MSLIYVVSIINCLDFFLQTLKDPNLQESQLNFFFFSLHFCGTQGFVLGQIVHVISCIVLCSIHLNFLLYMGVIFLFGQARVG